MSQIIKMSDKKIKPSIERQLTSIQKWWAVWPRKKMKEDKASLYDVQRCILFYLLISLKQPELVPNN